MYPIYLHIIIKYLNLSILSSLVILSRTQLPIARRLQDCKHRFYIVFECDEGQDTGGLLRELHMIISKDIFNSGMWFLTCFTWLDSFIQTNLQLIVVI